MPRGAQLTRILRLIKLLDRDGGVSPSAVARQLGCSRRTVYRDLQVLEQGGFPLYSTPDGGGGRWRLTGTRDNGAAAYLTPDELVAIGLARELLARFEDLRLHQAGETAFQKLTSHLSTAERAFIQDAADLVDFPLLGITPTADCHAARLWRAARSRLTVELHHTTLDRRVTDHLFDPYLLWHDPIAGTLHAAGWDHARKALHTFTLDRVHDVHPTLRPFALPATWDPHAFLAGPLVAFRGRTLLIRLLFRNDAARLIVDRSWHPTQVLDPNPDGTVILSFRSPLCRPLTAWILSWLPDVRVLGPSRLVHALSSVLRAAVQI